MRALLLIALFSSVILINSLRVYNVTAHRYYTTPIISNQTGSQWLYNYNAAAYTYEGNVELLVRAQNLVNKTSGPYNVGPSTLSPSQVTFNGGSPVATPTEYIAYVANNSTEACGTEDPRIAELNGMYYMFYTAYNCTNAMLSVSAAQDPADPESWISLGYVFPQFNWSKSGAPLFASSTNNLTQHYLFWGDSTNPVGGIGIATSTDGVHWTDTGDYVLSTRSSPFFDTALVEAGPPPVQLSTGDFFFIYNSARSGYPSVKPDWELQYNPGFVILKNTDPTVVTQRSLLPLLSPSLAWETGNTTSYLTPDVIFIEGLVPDPTGCPSGNYNCFVAFYGGADSDVGAARIIVQWYTTEDEEEFEDSNEYIEI